MTPDTDANSDEHRRKADYSAAYKDFSRNLSPAERQSLGDATRADWGGHNTFALPVRPDDPAYTSDPNDPVIETLEELKEIDGAMPKIALWVSDQIGGLNVILAMEQFRIALARICEAKNPRLESYLISLAIGMNLLGNSNGYAISEHFGLTPQTFHEMLDETCKTLGVAKPLSKVNKSRYRDTNFQHSFKAKS